MINTYTCIPNQTSSETVFADLKTFFEDKWTWSKIETNKTCHKRMAHR